MTTPAKILTIAGSDSGGGAGIQADIKAISALGGFAMSAITAITAQNTQEVRAVHPIPLTIIAEQISAVAEDIGVDAAKTGMLASTDIIQTVAKQIQRYKISPVVVDPVMVSTSGARLLEESAVDALKNELFPLATIITPNLPEAEILLEQTISPDKLAVAAQTLSERYGVPAVLLKGGHLLGDEVIDTLYIRATNSHFSYRSPRIITRNTHGTGCSLAAAIATLLAKPLALDEAVNAAIHYLTGAIESGKLWELGSGSGPVNHFWRNQSPNFKV